MLKVPQSTAESEPLEGARTARRVRRAGLGVLACGILLIVAAGGLYWRATTGSVSFGFISGRVEAALRERLPPDARVAVGSTALSYREGQGVILRIQNVQLVLPGLARVSVVDIATRTTLSALAGGRVDLQSVTASGLEIAVTTPSACRAGACPSISSAPPRRASWTRWRRRMPSSAMSGSRRMVIRQAAVDLDDEDSGKGGAPLMIAEASWAPLGPSRSKVWLQVLEPNGHDWDITLEQRKLDNGESSLTLEVEDLPITSLAPALRGTEGSPYFRSLLTLQARLAKTADDSFLGLRGMISASDGQLSLNGFEEVKLDLVALNFALDKAGSRVTIPNGEIRTGNGRASFEGLVDLGDPGHATLVARVTERLASHTAW